MKGNVEVSDVKKAIEKRQANPKYVNRTNILEVLSSKVKMKNT